MNTRIIPFAILLLAAMSLVGCGSGEKAPAAGGDTKSANRASETTRQTTTREGDPCSLLEPKDVEEVTGPLAGPPFHAKEGGENLNPVAGGDSCVYETPDFRTIAISVEWTDGATALKAVTLASRLVGNVAGTAETAETSKKAAKTLLVNGIQIDGEWDEAGVMGCCLIYALRGDSLVTFDYRGWRADTDRAVRILNKALLRLDKPLSVDGDAGVDAAVKRASLRPMPRSICGLLSRAEVEAILGPLLADPHPPSNKDTEGCTYRFTQAESKESTLAEAPKEFKSIISAVTGGRSGLVQGPVDTGLMVVWRGGFRRMNDSALVSNAFMTNLEGVRGLPKRTEGKVEGGPWDEAGQTGLYFTAVKKDVAIMADTPPMLSSEQVELRRRLVAKAIEKISQ